jgi:uncharacterized protein
LVFGVIVDCHVHVCAFTPEHGGTSEHLLNTIPFRFMRCRLALKGADAQTETALESTLATLIDYTPEIDAVVVLAFDAVYDDDGNLDAANTHLHVTNDHVMELARRDRRMLFGASVHPYRKDAAQQLERCIAGGAVLLKWLPIVQDFDPSDERCFPLYDVLAHHNVPLLCHTGGEKSLPNLNTDVADPMLLEQALKRGVRVIAAHCGTRSTFTETDFVPEWARLAREYEHFYGDTAALNLPTRSYAYKTILEDELLRSKLVHGSDWPILPLPPARVGVGNWFRSMSELNWLRRDVLIKRDLGLTEDAYWRRAAKLLRFSSHVARAASP